MSRRPGLYAALLAGAYLVLAGLYIVVSTAIAAGDASSVAELHRAEQVKGLIFVLVTGGLLFALALVLFSRLARADRREARAREALLAAERRASAGLFAASVAHDFNNLLCIVDAGLAELQAGGAEQAAELHRQMATAVQRGTELAGRLSRAGKERADERMAEIDLAAAVDECLRLIKLQARAKGCRLALRSDGPLRLRVYPALVQQLVTNLLLNAIEAVAAGGAVEVRLSPTGGGARIEVHDDGPGVPDEAREALFEAFYTTKPEGTGLGLLSARTCAAMHHGRLELTASPLGGACFRAELQALESPTPFAR